MVRINIPATSPGGTGNRGRCRDESCDGGLRVIVSDTRYLCMHSKSRHLHGGVASRATLLVALAAVSVLAVCSGAVLCFGSFWTGGCYFVFRVSCCCTCVRVFSMRWA